MININLPFTRSQKWKDVEIVGVEIQLTNSVLKTTARAVKVKQISRHIAQINQSKT